MNPEIPRRKSSEPFPSQRTTVKELQAMCKEHHLRYSGLRKAELIESLKKMNLI
jgi:hypothetical protein